MVAEPIVHDVEALQGATARTRCGLDIARTPSFKRPGAPRWTGWWHLVSCPACQQRYAHILECAKHYGIKYKPKEINFMSDEEIEW